VATGRIFKLFHAISVTRKARQPTERHRKFYLTKFTLR